MEGDRIEGSYCFGGALLYEFQKQKIIDSNFVISTVSLESNAELIYRLRSGIVALDFRFDLVLSALVMAEYEVQIDEIEFMVISLQRKSKN